MNEVISDRFLSIKQAANLFNVSTRTIGRWEKAGQLPPKTRLSHKTVGWRASRFQAFMDTL